MAQDPTNLHIVPGNDGKSFVVLVQIGAQYFDHDRNLEDEEPAEREPAEKEAEVETVDDDDAEENSGEEDMRLDFSHIPIPNAQAALAIACRRGYLEVLELLDDKYHRKTDTTNGTGGQSGATARKTSHKRS